MKHPTLLIAMLLSGLAGAAEVPLRNDSDNPADAVAQLGDGGGRIVISAPVALAADLTVPEQITLEFTGNGSIEVGSGVTLTVNGPLRAGSAPIFRGDGRVTGRVQAESVLPQWFGAKGDGVADDAPALRKAAELARYAMGRKLLIPVGRYFINDSIDLRCNVDCQGVLEKRIILDESKTAVGTFTFTPVYHPARRVQVRVLPDEAEIPLDPAAFTGLKKGGFKLANYAGIARLDRPGEVMDLAAGGTLKLHSSDFFSSRNNQKGDEYYTKNDYFQILTAKGDLYPESCFDYAPPGDAPAWDAAKRYRRGEYVTAAGKLFKATFPSGPETFYDNKHLGKVAIGPVDPAKAVKHHFQYENGQPDSVVAWVEVKMIAGYLPPQPPLTISGLAIEISCPDPEKRVKPISDSTFVVNRSNSTFHRLKVVCVDRDALVSSLMSIANTAHVVFNDCTFSGATYHGLGYNILNSNTANITYRNCISVNCRDGMAGRHGKNITIDGGHFYTIDDHYGLNYLIRNVDIQAVSTFVPGYCTPQADVSKWRFAPRTAVAFGGGNLTMENCRIYNGYHVLNSRADIGDFFGAVTLRNLTVTVPSGDVSLVSFATYSPDRFDYAHSVPVPARLLLENIVLNGPGKFNLTVNNLASPATPLPVVLNRVGPLRKITAGNSRIDFDRCVLDAPEFASQGEVRYNFTGSEFLGFAKGLKKEQIGYARGNVAAPAARFPVTDDFVNPKFYRPLATGAAAEPAAKRPPLPNRIPDGAFDAMTGDKLPAGWTRSQFSGGEGTVLPVPRGQGKAIAITNTSGKGVVHLQYNCQLPKPLEKPLLIEVTYSAAAENLQQGMFVFSGRDAEKKQQQWVACERFSGTFDWKEHEAVFEVQPGIKTIEISFRATGAGTLKIDDCTLRFRE